MTEMETGDMVYSFLRWLRGYLYIQLVGDSTERFINLCKNNGLLLWKIERKAEKCFCYMSLPDYKRIRRIARKTKIMPYARKRFGAPFLLSYLQRKKVFLTGIFLFFLILYLLSTRVWNITIQGEQRYTDEQLLKYLRSIDVCGGMPAKKVDCQEIEESIRGKYKDIGWVSAELKGSYLRIQLLENEKVSSKIKKGEAVHIVAAHAGTVQSIITREGRPMVHKGDYVKKGDILISGVVEVVGDNETLLDKKPVASDGDVVLETHYTYEEQIPLSHEKRVKTGKKFCLYTITIGNYNFYLYNPIKKFESFEKYDIMVSGDSVRLAQMISVPFSYTCKEYREMELKKEKYSTQDVLLIARQHYKRYLEKLKEKEIVVTREDVRYTVNDTRCIAKGRVYVSEPQTKTKKVKKDEWRMEQTDESNGDSDRNSNGT